jgi:hypothetical protein
LGRRGGWVLCTLGIIAAGILSRVGRTGFVVVDKYLGDALYAAMVYALLRQVGRARAAAGGAVVVMTGMELFQLTGIPAGMLGSKSWVVWGCARLLGVQFGWLDLLAYGVGIGGIFFADARWGKAESGRVGEIKE